MIPHIDDVETPVVGRFYKVKTIFHNPWQRWMPVYGPPHEDKEFVNFPDVHYHIDWRFVAHDFYLRKLSARTTDGLLHGVVASTNLCKPKIVYRVMKMKRETPAYPAPSKVKWLRKLEQAYTFHKLGPGMTCPHRGICLKQIKPDADGLITCIGHGLTWNPRNGLLVRQT